MDDKKTIDSSQLQRLRHEGSKHSAHKVSASGKPPSTSTSTNNRQHDWKQVAAVGRWLSREIRDLPAKNHIHVTPRPGGCHEMNGHGGAGTSSLECFSKEKKQDSRNPHLDAPDARDAVVAGMPASTVNRFERYQRRMHRMTVRGSYSILAPSLYRLNTWLGWRMYYMYIAVTQPIKYAKHKNSRRVCLTILLVWAISAAIGSPIVLGLNNTPDRSPDLCALRTRAKKQRAARKPHLSEITAGGSIIENIAQTKRLAETQLHDGSTRSGSKILPDEERPTNTASGSNEEDDENAGLSTSASFSVVAQITTTTTTTTAAVGAGATTQQVLPSDPNGNHDSGYAPSSIADALTTVNATPPDSLNVAATVIVNKSAALRSRNGSPRKEARCGVQQALSLNRNDSTLSTNSRDSSRKDKKNTQASR
ncbi:dopamine D2-like receptor [Anopheles darlingi]|uniref:Dopamine D2-like receptor n=1 Tax=Anopheles darlingi TaxID=43151 RepID=W5J2A9_ANODA|nr:dopamine D2-like receptor [Anopheles darlingi]